MKNINILSIIEAYQKLNQRLFQKNNTFIRKEPFCSYMPVLCVRCVFVRRANIAYTGRNTKKQSVLLNRDGNILFFQRSDI